MKSAFAVLLILCLSSHLMAQVNNADFSEVDDSSMVIGLDSVDIFSKSISPNEELIAQVFLKTNPFQTYAELLQKQSGVFIRSDGYGVLSTPSFKGLGTMQMPIIINGVNMQSSMNGTMDLSLIDAIHFNTAQFGSSDLQTLGSPSLGAGVAMDSDLSNEGIDINLSYSNLRELGLGAKYSFVKKRFKYALSTSFVNSQNRISLKPYELDSILSNTDIQRFSLIQNMAFDLTSKSSIQSMLYFLNADRGIPPSIGENNQNRQQDKNIVHLFTYRNKLNSITSLKISNQLSHEKIHFFLSKNNIQTNNQVSNINTNISLMQKISHKTELLINVQNQRAYYSSDALINRVTWNRILASYELTKKFDKGSVKFVQGIVNWNNQWAMNAGLNGKILFNKFYSLKGELQKVYRLPVLNELYWYLPSEAVGNLALKPEEGYKLDFGLAYSDKKASIQINPHIGFFKNWIQWIGLPNSPQNISQVLVSGAVLNASYSYPINGYKFIVRSNMHYVRSVYRFDDKNTLRQNKQLIFTPRFTSNLTFSVIEENFGLFGNIQFVGKNYVATDNYSYIDAYYLVDIGGYYNHSKIRLGCSITNIMNTPYFTKPRTPLPGRTIKLTLNYQIKTKP